MIVRYMKDIKGTEREVHGKNRTWTSRRMVLAEDSMGFSFHETVIYADTETEIWYKNHKEAVYCIEGEGEIETFDDGRIYNISPGMMYALDQHDRHLLRATTEMRLICVFNPSLTGTEDHAADGSYPLPEKKHGRNV